MSLKDRKFNHEEDDFHLAMGISEETKHICKERIFFTSFSNSLQADELFDDREDAPKEFRTVTGDLERLISTITSPIEYEYTLLIFMMYQQMAKEVYSRYRNFNEDSAESREEKIKMQILKGIMKLKELKDREEAGETSDDNDNFEIISKESLTERIKLVKKSGYNFDKYLYLVKTNGMTPNKVKRSDFDISDLLSGLFSGDDDSSDS
jgi:hypothetical protein